MSRWNPFREFEEMMNRYSRLMPTNTLPTTSEVPGKEMMTKADWSPRVDISETPKAYMLKAELPEVRREDVKLNVHDQVLYLAGERHFEKETEDVKHHRIERVYGSFARSFTLPADADDEAVAAQYQDGVLIITIPKTPQSKPRTIDIPVH